MEGMSIEKKLTREKKDNVKNNQGKKKKFSRKI